MGYINYFVEHQGLKAIILAHEDKLLKNDGCNDSYKEIKEKLIGKTLLIVPDLDSAIDDFIGKVTDLAAKEFLTQNHLLIAETYNLTGFKNLRILKQSLWDFERIYLVLPEKAISKPELVKKILRLSLIFSLEVRVGELPAKDIININQSRFLFKPLASSKNDPKDKSPNQKFIEKYSVLDSWDPIPEVTFWSEYLEKGTINKEIMNASIDNSSFFLDENPPNWVKLWHYLDLSDDEFEVALQVVEEDYKKKEYKPIGVIKHIVGLFLQLSEVGLYPVKKDQIFNSAKLYVDILKSNSTLEALNLHPDFVGYGGLGFHGIELTEFKKFCDYVRTAQLEVQQHNLPNEAIELMEIMNTDPFKFAQMIFLSTSVHQSYYDKPILNYINSNDFLESFIKLKPQDRRFIARAMDERYKPECMYKILIDELDWLKEVNDLLKDFSEKNKGKLSGYGIGVISSTFEEIISRFGG